MAVADEVEDEDRQRADKLEGASIDAANEGLKALLLLNGGACIALLGFLASTMGKDNLRWAETQFVVAATRSLVYFGAGSGGAVLTSLFAYLCNQEYSKHLRYPKKHPHSWKIGKWLNRIGLLFVIASLACFALGVAQIASTLP